MKFIHILNPGGPEVLELRSGPIPKILPHELLIQVAAAGVNRPDILQRKGAYPPPPGASPILGLEVSGTVVEVGTECSGWKKGDLVCALVAGGGYAEYCAAPALQCLPVPKGISLAEAAALPESFFTVWANVFMRGHLKSGETILIHGGSSGIGTTAIQLAKAFGARVFVTVGNDEKGKACLGLGADAFVNYQTQDFVSEIRTLSNHGVDLILDMVGGEYFERNLELLNFEGRIVQIAFQKGDRIQFSLKTLMRKGATVTGSTLRPRSIEQKGEIAAELLQKVWPLLESKKIRVSLDSTHPLEQAQEAHRRMESSSHIGKIVLIVSNGT